VIEAAAGSSSVKKRHASRDAAALTTGGVGGSTAFSRRRRSEVAAESDQWTTLENFDDEPPQIGTSNPAGATYEPGMGIDTVEETELGYGASSSSSNGARPKVVECSNCFGDPRCAPPNHNASKCALKRGAKKPSPPKPTARLRVGGVLAIWDTETTGLSTYTESVVVQAGDQRGPLGGASR
jgi:hypothetical protein